MIAITIIVIIYTCYMLDIFVRSSKWRKVSKTRAY